MVAYSFKGQFAEPILAGVKRQTIRAHRKRHARPGETLQLYTGMRTKHCRLVGRAMCIAARGVELDFAKVCVTIENPIAYPQLIYRPSELDAFAVQDGFTDWTGLVAFWAKNHPGVEIFDGVLIAWGPLLTAEGAAHG